MRWFRFIAAVSTLFALIMLPLFIAVDSADAQTSAITVMTVRSVGPTKSEVLVTLSALGAGNIQTVYYRYRAGASGAWTSGGRPTNHCANDQPHTLVVVCEHVVSI